MDPKTLFEILKGFGAAGIGACAAYGVAFYQQRRQDRREALQRRITMNDRAIEEILEHGQKLMDLACTRTGSSFKWTPEMGKYVDAIETSALRLTDKELRDAVDAACAVRFGAGPSATTQPIRWTSAVKSDPKERIVILTRDVRKVLGAYMRGDREQPETVLLQDALRASKQERLAARHGRPAPPRRPSGPRRSVHPFPAKTMPMPRASSGAADQGSRSPGGAAPR